MNKIICKSAVTLLLSLSLFSSCSDDSPVPDPSIPEGKDVYVLITMSDNKLDKPGFATAFDALPSGNVINNGNTSRQGLGFGGWRQ